MEFKLIQGAGNEKYIKKCVSLDKKCYSKEYQGDFETYMHIYKTNPNSFIFIVEGEVLIGYSIMEMVIPRHLCPWQERASKQRRQILFQVGKQMRYWKQVLLQNNCKKIG